MIFHVLLYLYAIGEHPRLGFTNNVEGEEIVTSRFPRKIFEKKRIIFKRLMMSRHQRLGSMMGLKSFPRERQPNANLNLFAEKIFPAVPTEHPFIDIQLLFPFKKL